MQMLNLLKEASDILTHNLLIYINVSKKTIYVKIKTLNNKELIEIVVTIKNGFWRFCLSED